MNYKSHYNPLIGELSIRILVSIDRYNVTKWKRLKALLEFKQCIFVHRNTQGTTLFIINESTKNGWSFQLATSKDVEDNHWFTLERVRFLDFKDKSSSLIQFSYKARALFKSINVYRKKENFSYETQETVHLSCKSISSDSSIGKREFVTAPKFEETVSLDDKFWGCTFESSHLQSNTFASAVVEQRKIVLC